MKHLFFLASIPFFALQVFAQTDIKPFIRTIEVTGSAELEVEPDEVYLSVNLREYMKEKNVKKFEINPVIICIPSDEDFRIKQAEKYSDMTCVFSPDNIGQIDIFVDTSDINLPDNRLLFINSENVKEIYLEEVVQPTLYNIIICGIPGIKNIYFNDDENSFETDGSNFQELLGLPFIDSTKTISNNVWDIYNTLGVEATRQFLIEEFMSIMEGINRCHIQLLSEKMTFNGSISSISRYTMRNEECGPMGKASFEETMDNFLKAGLYGEQEETKGVSASIICGKIAHI